jgi:hypothetical protein
MKQSLATLSLLVFLSLSVSGQAKKQAATDEVLAKHRASIGAPDAFAKHNSRVMVGEALMTSKGTGAVKLGGPVQLASAGEMFLLAMVFEVAAYPYEKVAFDGDDVSFGRHTGVGSSLTFFLRANKGVLKRGLFGGTLNAGWALTKSDAAKSLDSAGVATVNGRTLHKFKYTTSGLGDLVVTIFIEDGTFHHVGTEYKFTSSGLMSYSPSGLSGGSSDGPEYYTLTESFGGFSKVGDLTLPLTYNVEFTHKTAIRSYNWNMKFSQAFFEEKLEPSVFKVS